MTLPDGRNINIAIGHIGDNKVQLSFHAPLDVTIVREDKNLTDLRYAADAINAWTEKNYVPPGHKIFVVLEDLRMAIRQLEQDLFLPPVAVDKEPPPF